MVTIKGTFNGPPTTGNGGYVGGLVANAVLETGLDSPAQIRLHQPPPLDTPLTFESDSEEVRLLTPGGAIIATGRTGKFQYELPQAVTMDEALRGQSGYKGHGAHPFKTCFSCGPSRNESDGLRIFPGPIAEDRVAAPWDVTEAFAAEDGTVPSPIVWAAIDCVGGWAADQSVQPMLLGTMTAEVIQPPKVGQTYTVVGEVVERAGRKIHATTGLFTTDGELIAHGEQVWIAIDI